MTFKEEKSTPIKVKKVWKDQTNKVTDPMEEKVIVELYKDGKATGKKVTLNDANNWTATFEQIENTSESKYTVKEIGEKDGRIEIRRDFYSVIYEGNSKDGFTVENKYINEERAYVPIGKHIILPKGTADQKRENLLYLVNGPDDEWNFTYKIEKLKDKDTVEREYDPITITIPNIIKEDKNTFFQDISQKIGRNISSIDQLSNDEIDDAYYIAREKLLRVRGAEDHEIKIEQNVHGEGEAIFRVTENPSNYVNISDDKNNERYHYYKVYKDENGEFDIYWNFANSYDKLDRNNKNYFEDDGEYEELFKEAVGETWFEYIGQSNNYSSRDIIRFNLLSSYYNKIKSPTQIDPSKTDIKVKKVWKDQTNKVTDPMEEKVIVELYKDGKATGKKVTLNDANNWTATFEQIENTSESKYTVKEIGEKDGRIEIRRDFYSVIYEGNSKDGFTVENKYINEERAYVPIGKHIILPKGTADQKRENLLYLVNGPDDEWNFTYKIEKLKDKDTVEREYDPITITIPNIIKEDKNTFFQDISQKIGRNISSIDQLSNDEIDDAYYIAREKLLRVRGAEDHEIKIEQNVHGEGEAIFRVTENPSNYVNISDDKNNERYHYYKVYKDENGEFDIYWNFANSYDKLDRNNKNYFEDDGEYEELFKEAVGETWFEYIGQSNNYSSRDIIRFNLLSSYYNKIKSKTPWIPITPSKTDVKVKKAWEDKDGKEIAAPVEKIEVELYKDGKATGKNLELNKANKWSGEFKDLDVVEKLDSEKAFEYTVKEVGEEKGKVVIGNNKYEVKYSGSMKDGFTITNKEEPIIPPTPLNPPKEDIKVEKKWQDKDGKEIAAPVDKIEVELYRDGQATGEKTELNAGNNWSGEFKDLDVVEKLDSEKAFEYTVKEVGEEKGKVVIGNNKYEVKYSGSMEDGFTITNKEESTIPPTPLNPPKEDIKVEKNWQDKDGRELVAPVDKIEVELYRDGKATGKKLELSKVNKWSGEFKDLDVVEKLDSKEAYKYSVKEVGEENGSIKLNGTWYKVNYSGSMKDGFTITNKEEPKTPPTPPTPSDPETITIKVKKDWTLYGNKPVDKIVVELYRDGEATGKLLDLNKDNNWSGEFKNLDVKKGANSTHDYHYTIKEIGESGSTIKLDGRWFDVNYLGNMKDGFTIVNKEEKPTEPGKPEEPNTPNKPNDPQEPNKPNDPQEPNKPETPKEPEKPNNPGTPVKPNTPKTPLPGKQLPKTGNGLNPSTYAWILLGLGNLSTFAGVQRKKRIKSRRKKNVK